MKPLDDVISFSKNLSYADQTMLVGHLPFMEKITSYLVIQAVEPCIFKFQNGGILCLDKHPDTLSWVIKWALMPEIG